MNWRDIKYFSAFIIPALCYYSIDAGGIFSYCGVVFAFVFIPLLEPLLKSSEDNLDEETKVAKLSNYFFDALLYLNLPIIAFLLFSLISKFNHTEVTLFETIGYILSFGTLLGACGINVAHELGHKDSIFAKITAVGLLLPSLYTHFIIEHNRGHHKNVATPKDPATANKNEVVFSFWLRSIIGGYINAWKLEGKRLKQRSNKFGLNLMVVFTIITVAYIALLYYFVGLKISMVLIAIGILSIVFLETINYVEHYGLQRELLPSGRYERVMPRHSWNSNHYLGRIILYELTRHSDHHYLANKKYQILDHHDNSPQLPFGYPTSMLLSLCPPLWFKVMNSKLS